MTFILKVLGAILFISGVSINSKARKNKGNKKEGTNIGGLGLLLLLVGIIFSPSKESATNIDSFSNEELKQMYSESIDKPYYKVHSHYYSLISQWENIITQIDNGEISSFDAYSKVDNLNKSFKNLNMEHHNIENVDFLNESQKETHSILSDNTILAILDWEDITKNMANMLDKNEVTNSALKDIQDKIASANTYMNSAEEAKKSLDNIFGVITIEE